MTNRRGDIASEVPWRERIELGVALVDELGPIWIAIEGEDFFERMELAVSLTEELSTDWLAIFCYCGNSPRPLSCAEISASLGLEPGEVARCLVRLGEEGLVEEVGRTGTYVLGAKGRAELPRSDVRERS